MRAIQANGEVTLPKKWRDRVEPKAVMISENECGELVIEAVK